jgi:hypothetical protein
MSQFIQAPIDGGAGAPLAAAWESGSLAPLLRLVLLLLLIVALTGCWDRTGPIPQVQSDNTLGVVDPTGGADFSDIPVVLPSSPTPVSHLSLQSAHLPDLRQHEKLVH